MADRRSWSRENETMSIGSTVSMHSPVFTSVVAPAVSQAEQGGPSTGTGAGLPRSAVFPAVQATKSEFGE